MNLDFWTFISLYLLPVCIKIFNSVIVFGLYYGFVSSFSMGPSLLFLNQALAREEAIEKKAAAMSGTFLGQLIMFISIFYAPLHLVLGQSTTMSVLSLSYLLLNFFNKGRILYSGSSNQGSFGYGKIVGLFLSNLIFQCLNHFFFPSSVLFRLINVYIFRSNKKMLFLTSSFAGWLFGWVLVYLFFGKFVGAGVLWIRENPSIRSHKFIRYVVAKFRNSMTGIFSILLVTNCAYLLSRISVPIKPARKKAEIAVEIETADEEDPSSSLFLEERADDSKQIDETEEIRANRSENDENSRILPKKPAKKDLFFFEKNIVPLLFDCNQWNRPLRYIKNEKLEQAVRNEMGNSFCANCVSDGKERIAFSFPPSVSIFREMVKRKRDSFLWNSFSRHLEGMPTWPGMDRYASWVSRNKKNEKQAKKEFINRIKSLAKKSSFVTSLATRTRLCNDDSTNQYLPKIYDPLLRGPCRKTIEKNASPKNILKKTFIQNFGINRLQQFLIGYSDIPEEHFDIEDEEMIWFHEITHAKDRIKELEEKINLTKKKKKLGTRGTFIKKSISRVVGISYFLIKKNAQFCVGWIGVVIGGNIFVDTWRIGKALFYPPSRGLKMAKHLGKLVFPYTLKFLMMDLRGESFCNFRYGRYDFTYWRLGKIGKLMLEIELLIPVIENDFLGDYVRFRFNYKNLGLSLGVLRFLDQFYYGQKQNLGVLRFLDQFYYGQKQNKDNGQKQNKDNGQKQNKDTREVKITYAKDRIKELEEKINLKKKLRTRGTFIKKSISRVVDISYFLIKKNAQFCVGWIGVVIVGNTWQDTWRFGKAVFSPPIMGWKPAKRLGQLVFSYTLKFLRRDLTEDLTGEFACDFRHRPYKHNYYNYTYARLGKLGKLMLETELIIFGFPNLLVKKLRFDYKNLGLSLGVLRFLDQFYYGQKQNREVKTEEEELELAKWIKVKEKLEKEDREVKTEELELELELAKWIKVKEKLEKEDRERKRAFAKRAILLADASSEKRNRRQNQINEISHKIPKWQYKLITELEQQELSEEVAEDFEIRAREAKEVVVFKAIKEDKDDPDQIEELTMTRYLEQPDFDRDIIKGSVRAQRRKVGVWKVFQGNAHSPLFLSRIKKSILFSLPATMFELIQSSIRNRVRKGEASQLVESLNEQTKREENRIEIENEEELQILEEGARIKIAEAWDNFHPYAQGIRAFLLLMQSIFRKYILLPSFIIAKNVGRICLSQGPEWSDDFREWKRELHIICTYNGVPLSETELPPEWFIEGLQIRIVFPFRLKPWHNHKLRSSQEKEEFCFLTVFGLEAKHPFGFAEKRPSFWKPVLKQLGKRVGKMKKNYFKGKKKRLAKVSKENPIPLREVEISESQEIPEEKDFTSSNPLINQSFSQRGSPGLTNSSLTEKKIKDLTERIGTIRNQIERIRNKKRKNDTSANKTFNAQILAKWKIVKRRTLRFISKFPLYLKLIIALISRHIFFSSTEWKLSGVWKFLLNSSYFAIQTRLRLTKNRIEKSLDLIKSNKMNSQKMNKKKKNPISFKKSLDNIRHMKSHLHNFFDLSCVSQAYVFYQLSQMEVSNLHKLRSVLQYEGISLFLKPEIKDSLEKQGLVHSKFKLDPKKLRNSKKNQWKNWLRGYYPYNLSSISWSRLMPEKWRNTCHQPCTDKKEKLSKWNSYETDRVFDYKKKWEVPKLANQKENVQKSYRYDLLADKFLNSAKCKEKMDGFTFHGNKNRDLSWNTHKDPLSDILTTYNSVDMLAVEKMVNRKYLRLKSFSRYRSKKVDIESCITIDSNRNPTIQGETNNYLKISRQDAYSESEMGYFRLPDNRSKFQKVVLDWMGMNEEMLNYSISNLEGWFFPEFVLFHQAYKLKPWFRPNQLLLFNLNRNENSIENKKRKCKKKQENQEEPLKGGVLGVEEPHQSIPNEDLEGEDLGSVLSEEKSSEENDVKLDKKKKKSQLDFFLERFLLFQLKWRNSTLDEKMMNNIDAYCLLLTLIDPSEMFVSLIQTREIDLDIMISSSVTHAEFLTKAILVIEPIRLFGKMDGQFLMYQTISTSLVDKSKYETNPKYQEERYVSKKHIDFLIPENIFSFRHRRKLRILISLNSKYRNDENRNRVFGKGKNRKNSNQASPENKGLNREENALMKLKLFLWPNYRLEDLACMNRYWFNTNNGSRFSMLRIHLYPRLKISRY
nr:hypothetical chloroplast RF19 [Plantago coronopus]QWL15929.1 hypothetical chloroplast RF19 [Plantago coronopus]